MDNLVVRTPVVQFHHSIFIWEVFRNVADTTQMCSFILMAYRHDSIDRLDTLHNENDLYL